MISNRRFAPFWKKTDFESDASIKNCSERVRALFSEAPMDYRFSQNLKDALEKKKTGSLWAVRSSAVIEDRYEASFAGQQVTFLCVSSSEVPEHVKM